MKLTISIKELFKRVNKLLSAMADGRGKKTIGNYLASLSPNGLTANAVSKMCPVPAYPTNTIPTSTFPIHADGVIQFCPVVSGWYHRPLWVILYGHPETMPVVLPCAFHPKMPLSSEPIPPVGCR